MMKEKFSKDDQQKGLLNKTFPIQNEDKQESSVKM